MQPFIRVHQLRQSFGTQEVLKGVSFDVGKGELMALIGGSGAGKSVILKHLDGLMDPLDGYVEIAGGGISRFGFRRTAGTAGKNAGQPLRRHDQARRRGQGNHYHSVIPAL